MRIDIQDFKGKGILVLCKDCQEQLLFSRTGELWFHLEDRFDAARDAHEKTQRHRDNVLMAKLAGEDGV